MIDGSIRISLKSARINAGYTLKEASKLLNVSISSLHNWETGKHEPSATKARDLSNLYKIPYDNLIFLQSDSK